MENSAKNNDDESQSILFDSFERAKSVTHFYPSLNASSYMTSSKKKETKSFDSKSYKKIYNKELELAQINNISLITENMDDFIDDDELINEYYLKNNYKPLTFEKMLIIYNYLIDFFEFTKNEKLSSKNKIIRCFHDDKNNKLQKDKEKCFYVPIIIKTARGMKFSCDNQNFKFLLVQDIIQKILQKELFIETSLTNNNYENQKEIKENKIKIKFVKSIRSEIKKIQRQANKHFTFSRKGVEKDTKIFKRKLRDYNNFKLQKSEIERKIKKIFFSLCKNVNKFLYWLIIKKLIKEILRIKQENKNFNIIKLNLDNAKTFFKINLIKREKDKLCLVPKVKKLKICSLVPFYFEEEIKNFLDKNIFIGIRPFGTVYIILLNIDFKIFPYEKSQYRLIKIQKLEQLKYQKRIFKLKKKCLIKDNKEKNNYFLICSYKEDAALLINVNEKLENPIEKKYEIQVKKTIIFERGLYSSIQIEYNNENYLLNYHKNFTLWFYDEKKDLIESKEIAVNKLKDKEISNDKYRYGPLIQGYNKNLIIAQIIYPFQRIEVYELSKDLCLNLKGYIELEENDNVISGHSNNNYFLYKDKYLLIASYKNSIYIHDESVGKMKTKIIKGGIYLFDINKYKYIKYIRFDDILAINSIIRINDDNMVCSAIIKNIRLKKQYFCGKLIILSIEENQNEINLIRKEKNKFIGQYEYINCDNFIDESYILCSSD